MVVSVSVSVSGVSVSEDLTRKSHDESLLGSLWKCCHPDIAPPAWHTHMTGREAEDPSPLLKSDRTVEQLGWRSLGFQVTCALQMILACLFSLASFPCDQCLPAVCLLSVCWSCLPFVSLSVCLSACWSCLFAACLFVCLHCPLLSHRQSAARPEDDLVIPSPLAVNHLLYMAECYPLRFEEVTAVAS